MLFNFNSKLSSKTKKNQTAHVLKTSPQDDFSQATDLAVIGPIDFLDSFINQLKKNQLKKNLALFSPENLTQKPSRHIQRYTDNIIAMTENTSGWILRGSSGQHYPAKACLLLLEFPDSLYQSQDLLLHNLASHRYVTTSETGKILLHANHSSISDSPRVSSKLFLCDLSYPSDLPIKFQTLIQTLSQTLWE